MKTMIIVECRSCAAKTFSEDKEITISPNEEVDFVIKTISKCTSCKARENRSITGSKKPLKGEF